MVEEIHNIIETIYCFRNSRLDDQIGRSDSNARKDALNQTIEQTIIGNQTVVHKNSSTGNASIIKSGINEHQECQYADICFIDLSVLLKSMPFFVLLQVFLTNL